METTYKGKVIVSYKMTPQIYHAYVKGNDNTQGYGTTEEHAINKVRLAIDYHKEE